MRTLKNIQIICVLALSSLALTAAAAPGLRSPVSQRERQLLVQGLAHKAQTCLIENSTLKSKTTSKCADVIVISEHQLQMLHHNNWYIILTKDSGDSDGGDLTDLYIYDRNGSILSAHNNLPAFRNIKTSILIAAKIVTSL